MVQEQLRQKRAYALKLKDLFIELDTSGDGKPTIDEFETMLSDPAAKAYLSGLEVDAHEIKSLFYLLDDGDGNITHDEFINGIMRLKGQARSQDVVAMGHDMRKLEKEFSALARDLRNGSLRSFGASKFEQDPYVWSPVTGRPFQTTDQMAS